MVHGECSYRAAAQMIGLSNASTADTPAITHRLVCQTLNHTLRMYDLYPGGRSEASQVMMMHR